MFTLKKHMLIQYYSCVYVSLVGYKKQLSKSKNRVRLQFLRKVTTLLDALVDVLVT